MSRAITATTFGVGVALTIATLLLLLQRDGARPAAHSQAIQVAVHAYTPTPHSSLRAAVAAPNASTTSGPQPCPELSQIRYSEGIGYTANQIAQAYDLNPYYQAGDTGQGQTIAVLELEPNNPSDIGAFQTCYGTSSTVNYVPVDGGVGTGDGSGEAALDIEQLIATAPGATIDVYQAPNTSSGILDAFTQMLDNPSVNVISTSWGSCESDSAGLATQEATLFEKAARNGVTVAAAAGDDGSSGCATSALAVDDPASQPDVLAVGGTSLPNPATPDTQSVWDDSSTSSGAGGGGVSGLWAMPSWQYAAARPQVATAIQAGAPACAAANLPASDGGTQSCRAVPDLSADADPYTGYWIILTNSSTGNQNAVLYGGTSAAAPLMAGMIALANASAACNEHPLGFINKLLYTATSSATLTDIASGNNDYTPDGSATGQYAASSGYDLASGLGAPVGQTLGNRLCAAEDQVTVSNPGTVNSDNTVNVQITGTDKDQAALAYTATGLPSGVTINPGTGLITGTSTAGGDQQVTVTATAPSGASASSSFTLQLPPAAPTQAAPATDSGTTAGGASTTTPVSQKAGEGATTATPRSAIVVVQRVHGQTVVLRIPAAHGTPNVTISYAIANGLHVRSVQLVLVNRHGRKRPRNSQHSRYGHFSLRWNPQAASAGDRLELVVRYQRGRGRHTRTYTATLQVTAAVRKALRE